LRLNPDDFVKSRKTPFFVIPAEAGTQSFQMVTDGLDSGYRIESGTSFTGVTTFYEFINPVWKKVLNYAVIQLKLLALKGFAPYTKKGA